MMTGVWKKIKTKKFYLRVYALTSSVVIIIVTLLLWIVYLNAKNSIFDVEHRESSYYLDQIKKNINYIDESIKHVCITIFYDNDTQSLLNNNNEDTYEQMRQINVISNTFVKTNSFIHSIYLYNKGKDSYYSTYKSIYNIDEGFASLIQNIDIKNMKPIVRKIGEETVVTYMLSDHLNSLISSNRIYVNIKGSWFFKNIGSFNNADNSNSSKSMVFIYDEDRNLINNSDKSNSERINGINTKLSEHIGSLDFIKGNTDTLRFSVQNEVYIGSIIYSDKLNWTIIKVQPARLIFNATENLKNTILVINILVLVIALLLALLITKYIYKPIKNILQKVSEDKQANLNEDEFTYLNKHYQDYKDRILQMKKEKEDNKTLLKKVFLKKLIMNEVNLPEDKILKESTDKNVNIDLTRPLLLIVLSIDNLELLTQAFDRKEDNSLILFAIENILLEVFEQPDGLEVVYMGNYEMVVLANNCEVFQSLVKEKLENFQQQINAFLNITISCSISDPFGDYSNIPDSYLISSNNLLYKFLEGNGSIIVSEVISQHSKKIFIDFNFVEESSFIESLRNYYLDDAKKKLHNVISHIKNLEYQSALLAVVHLQTSIKNTLFEMNLKRKRPINANKLMFNFDDVGDMTLDDYHHLILQVIDSIDYNLNEKKQKSDLVAESIIKVIEEEYVDYDLGAASIADKLNLTASVVGKMFKEYTGLTIPKYINNYRLSKTIEWMENSNLTISEIILKVGYQNESYFFKIFKQKYGVTPRNYMIYKSVT